MHNMLNNRTRYFRGSQEGPSKCRGNPCHIFPSICSDSGGFVLMEASKMCLTLAKEHHHRDLLGPWAGGASLSCKSPITWLICRQTMQLLTLICQRWCTSSPSCKRYNTWLKVLCFALKLDFSKVLYFAQYYPKLDLLKVLCIAQYHPKLDYLKVLCIAQYYSKLDFLKVHCFAHYCNVTTNCAVIFTCYPANVD